MTDKKFTDEEIIEIAKDCCSESPHCINCPFDEDTITADECMGKLVDELQHRLTSCNSENAELKAEIEKFHKIADRLKSANATKYSNGYKVGYTKATKEFAERLKELSYLPNLSLTNMEVVDISEIDNLVKEMTEGKNNAPDNM